MRYLCPIYCKEIDRITFVFLETVIIYFLFPNYVEFPMFLMFQKWLGYSFKKKKKNITEGSGMNEYVSFI